MSIIGENTEKEKYKFKYYKVVNQNEKDILCAYN